MMTTSDLSCFSSSSSSSSIPTLCHTHFISCTISALLSLWIAVPIGYLMSRFEFRGKNFVDTILDVPIVLPPLVIGLGLLILFNNISFGSMDVSYVASDGSRYIVSENRTIERMIREFSALFGLQLRVTNGVSGVILAQFMVACAFATRAMRISFDQIPKRYEKVALTLGCNRGKAFWLVVMPQARRGILAAGTLAWARSLGEFGPILVFAGSTRMRTEVLPTSVYLEMQAGNLKGMIAISLIMIVAAAAVLVTSRLFGMKRMEP